MNYQLKNLLKNNKKLYIFSVDYYIYTKQLIWSWSCQMITNSKSQVLKNASTEYWYMCTLILGNYTNKLQEKGDDLFTCAVKWTHRNITDQGLVHKILLWSRFKRKTSHITKRSFYAYYSNQHRF